MQLLFTECSHEDLDQLVRIARTTFVAAFEAANNPADFKTYINSAFKKEKLSDELNNPNTTYYFVNHGKDLVAYFKLNENDAQTDLKSSDSLELERIYVLQEFQGKGIGKCIVQQVKRLAAKTNKTFLWLGVWEHNTKAIGFYEENGFSKFGMHPYYVGEDKQMDWLMRFDLINFKED